VQSRCTGNPSGWLTRVVDLVRLVIQPALRLLSVLVGDLAGRILVPVLRLGRLRVGDPAAQQRCVSAPMCWRILFDGCLL